MRKIQTGIFLTFILLASGCSSVVNSHRQKAPMMAALINGENQVVEAELLDFLKAPAWYNSSVINTGDELHWQLEAGSFYFHTGNYNKAVEHFGAAEKVIAGYDDRAKISLRDTGSEAAVLVTNLNALPYKGFGRDRIMLSFYKSLAYLGSGREDSFRAQVRRMRNTRKEVLENFRNVLEEEKKSLAEAAKEHKLSGDGIGTRAHLKKFSSGNKSFSGQLDTLRSHARRGYRDFLNPAAAMLSMIVSLRDGRYDNARIEMESLWQANPYNPFFRKYMVTLLKLTGRPVPAGFAPVEAFDFPIDRDSVYLFFNNGRGCAFKQELYSFPVSVAWPVCEFYPLPFSHLSVMADDVSRRSWQLADMDAIFAAEFEERLPLLATRITLSTLVKEGAKYTATAFAANQDPLLGALVFAGATLYNETFNTADTRSWEILPKEIQFVQFPMPQNRQISLMLHGIRQKELVQQVEIPADCRSAIIVVSAFSRNNVSIHVLPLSN